VLGGTKQLEHGRKITLVVGANPGPPGLASVEPSAATASAAVSLPMAGRPRGPDLHQVRSCLATPERPLQDNRIDPEPRCVHGLVEGMMAFDTLQARNLWEGEGLSVGPHFDKDHLARRSRAPQGRHSTDEPSSPFGLVGFHGNPLDQCFEEGEQMYVHLRNPNARSDPVRLVGQVDTEIDGIVLAEASSIVAFETGCLLIANPNPSRTLAHGDAELKAFQGHQPVLASAQKRCRLTRPCVDHDCPRDNCCDSRAHRLQ